MSNTSPLIDVVDDDPSVVLALKRLLNSWGLRVRSFASGAAFLSALKTARDADCSLIDVQMPGMTGLEVQSRLRREGSKVPVILITGCGDDGTLQAARGAGAAGLLCKPFSELALEELIRAVLQRRFPNGKEIHMMDAARYNATATLRNGDQVQVRAIRPDDKQRLVAAFRNLEPESIYTRFFHHKKTLSDEELKSATELDFDRSVALVVVLGHGEGQTIIGGGRYVILDGAPGSKGAEVAFTVEEDYHRQGIARILLQHLAAIARAKGVSHFVAEVLAENQGMLTVFARSGLPTKRKTEEGVTHLTLSLTDAAG